MRLKMTLLRSDSTRADIVVTTSATATIGEIAQQIVGSDPRQGRGPEAGSPVTLQVHRPGLQQPEFLAPTRPIGEARMGSGLPVSIVELDPHRDWSKNRLADVEAVIEVVTGPDRGQRFRIDSDSSWIGRDQSCDVMLSDEMVSKRHARVELEPGLVRFIDNNSANGLSVDGGLVNRVDLMVGARITLGESELEVASITQSRAAVAPTSHAGDTVEFNRAPRVQVRFGGEELEGPQIPTDERGQGFPWIMVVVPILMGVVLFLVTKSVLSVVFVAMSPLLILGNFLSQRAERKRKLKEQVDRFNVEMVKLEAKLQRLEEQERQVRLDEIPGLLEVVDHSENRGRLLWARRPEHWSFLTVRLGIGRSLSRTTISKKSGSERAIESFIHEVDELAERFEYIDRVPIVESFSVAGGIGVSGEAAAAAAFARGIVSQLVGLHSPAEVVVAAIVDPRQTAEFDWLKWLPHAAPAGSPIAANHLADNATSASQLIAALEEIVEQRTTKTEGTPGWRSSIDFEKSIDGTAKTAGVDQDEDDVPPRPAIILLVAGEPPTDKGRLVQLLERSADSGIYPLWLSVAVGDIPAFCRTYVEVGGDPRMQATVGFVREGRVVDEVSIEGIDADRALMLAKALAPVVDIGAYSPDDSDLPPAVSFVDLVGSELAEDPSAVIDRWGQNESIIDRSAGASATRRKSGKLRALVGQAGADAMHLDLRTQGPHALVGGTTGSGKSEFLQAWVLGMATEYSPDRVTFLFVDYKGGSAFADCVALPHCVGLVTDLNTHLVRRALTSLKAEIHFREHLFNSKKAKDLIELERRGDPECPPALIIVIDEFAALANEIPEFVDGVVDIAQRGRSLGIHLIMATQRPAGVIKDNLRANTNLRIALRMADESDSTDVVGEPIAAGFDPGLPGRGIAKSGPGRLVPFQSGYAGGWTTKERARARVDIADLSFGQGRVWELSEALATPASENGPNDSARLVTTFTKAASLAKIPTPRKPWLDELAAMYDLSKLRQRTDSELILGVADVPSAQAQKPVYFLPDIDGNIAIFGTGGSGKTTVLRTLAVAAAITPRGGPVEVYGLDFAAGGLKMLEALPHVGAIIPGDDSERVTRLFGWLRDEVERRVALYGTVRASSITDYRADANDAAEPRILVLIDGMATFRQEYEFTGSGAIFAAFQQLLSDGRAVGIHFAVTADRPGSISPSVSASIQRRVALRLADENDYALLDAPADILGATSPPGRAVIDGLETQIAILGGTRNSASQAKAIEDLADTLRGNGVREAPPVLQLQENILLSSISAQVTSGVPFGVVDDTLTAIGIEPSGVFMISGPPASGRTTLLLALMASVKERTPGATLTYFGSAKSPVAQLALWKNRALDTESAGDLARSLLSSVEASATAKSTHVILIESIADFLSTGSDMDMATLIKAARRNGHFVIAESETSTWSQSWPLLLEVKSARRGFALQPDQMEGEMLFKTAFPRSKRSEFPPGRGWLVEAGKARKVQAAYVE